ncbi:hypothetical protein LCGC14_2439750 [marine sediment metagenome]|uniref:Uncharacterized protein n=1 Tax=marine sediment metagenome TaxID=412755 RepID=A0A0F9BJH6_9ZZZZ
MKIVARNQHMHCFTVTTLVVDAPDVLAANLRLSNDEMQAMATFCMTILGINERRIAALGREGSGDTSTSSEQEKT